MKAIKRKLIPKKLPTLSNERPSMEDEVILQKMKAEKTTWDKVLTTILGRTPTPADYKRCKKVKADQNSADYTLYFDSVDLGRVVFMEESLVFHPAKRFR